MASTYSNLKIQLMATGENSGTWGNVTNDNLGIAIEQAITGSVDVTVSSNVTLSLTDSNAAQDARALRLNIGGSGGFNLTVPSIQKLYLVNNATLAAVVVKNASGSTVTVPTAKTMWVYSTGSGVVDAVTHLSSLTLGSALPIASGGTGSTSTTYANLQSNVSGTLPIANGGTGSTSTTYANLQSNVTGTLPVANGGTGSTSLTANRVLLGNGTSGLQEVAPGSNGNVLTSNGSTWTSAAPGGGAQGGRGQVFTSNGTFTIPTGVTALKITVVGGGGGGAKMQYGGCGNPESLGAGGGGGGTAIGYLTSLTPGNTLSVTVGSAGTAGTVVNTTAGTGGTSQVASGTQSITTISASGGGGGVGNTGSGAGGAGGVGTNGSINIRGGGGGGGRSTFSGGIGGGSTLGGGGRSAGGNEVGATGGQYGGGGSGGNIRNNGETASGGAGFAGVVMIEY